VTGTIDIVIPTVRRPSLEVLVRALVDQGVGTDRVIVVEDRARRGPAATRNKGWRASRAEWIAFLDDDVVPDHDWFDALQADIAACAPWIAATQGQLTVPLPDDRPPTDWERNVAQLEHARYITADIAYRRAALESVGGFDERFSRPYREDADLALRVIAAGFHITPGRRRVTHPVGPAPWHASIGKQAGNADDVLMQQLHGHGWRERAGSPSGARRRHVAVTITAVLALVLAPFRPRMAVAAASAWLAATLQFAWRRIAPGPRTPREIAAMLVTSAVLPANATAWWCRAKVRFWKESVHVQ
jgi:hypothetical protein